MKNAIYPGSFDPVTVGHLNIIRRAAEIFDKLTVCVMVNAGKNPMFTLEERMEFIKRVTKDLPNVEVDKCETLLVDYLGAEDTPYVRAVTRKTLVAAIARIYRPGIKFDSILVLNGDQGMGKSALFTILGKEWFSDSLSISDMKDKTAPEKLRSGFDLHTGEEIIRPRPRPSWQIR